MSKIPQLRELWPLLSDADNARQWLYENGVLKDPISCPKCGCLCPVRDRAVRCPCNACRHHFSAYHGTFFERLHLPLNEILMLAYFWLAKVPVTSMISMTGHASDTVSRMTADFEGLVSGMVQDHQERIGGPGIIVEMDESKFGKRKYHRGHHVEGVWVVGGVERTQKRGFFAVSVTDRDTDLIATLIQDHVNPGSIIFTDGWAAYPLAIQKLNMAGMRLTHRICNHKESFKAADGTCTNTIEGTWNGMKMGIPGCNMNSEDIDRKIMAFIWRRQNSPRLWDALMEAFAEVEYEPDGQQNNK